MACRRRQAMGLSPTMRRNTRVRCAWSHIPQASEIWHNESSVVSNSRCANRTRWRET